MATGNSLVEKLPSSLIKFKTFIYKWTIEDFLNWSTKNLQTTIHGSKYIDSDTFSFSNDDQIQFKLRLFPNGQYGHPSERNNVSINMYLLSNAAEPIDAYWKIWILNENNEKRQVRSFRYKFKYFASYFKDDEYNTSRYILNSLNRFLNNGSLVLLVEINIAEYKAEIYNSQDNMIDSLECSNPKKVIKTNNISYKWKISNFNSILNSKKSGTFIKSGLFHFPQNDQTQFVLKLYPNGFSESDNNFLSLFLQLESRIKKETLVQYKFAILDKSNNQLFCKENSRSINNCSFNYEFNFVNKNELLARADELLHQDTLTIVCELEEYGEEFLCKSAPKEIPQVTSILDNLNSSSNSKSSKTYTHLEVAKFAHTWTVGNFKVRCDQQLSGNDFIESQQFSPLNDNPIRFNLRMYPSGHGTENQKFVSIFLILTNCEQRKATVECRISIINTREDKCFSQVFKGVIEQGHKLGIEKFIQRDILLNQGNEFLPDGKLTILCELGIVGDSKINFEELSPNQSLPSVIGQAFNQALESGEHSDVVFVVEGKEIRAHKVFLASVSPVFGAMFKSNMRESNENRIEIIDIGHEVFRDMLSYIYSGKYLPKDQNIADLFVAADKYDLQNLKDLCENSLCSLVNSETVADLLTLADRHNADKLKTTLFDYINLQSPWLMKNENFISKISKQLVVELYNDMIDKQNF